MQTIATYGRFSIVWNKEGQICVLGAYSCVIDVAKPVSATGNFTIDHGWSRNIHCRVRKCVHYRKIVYRIRILPSKQYWEFSISDANNNAAWRHDVLSYKTCISDNVLSMAYSIYMSLRAADILCMDIIGYITTLYSRAYTWRVVVGKDNNGHDWRTKRTYFGDFSKYGECSACINVRCESDWGECVTNHTGKMHCVKHHGGPHANVPIVNPHYDIIYKCVGDATPCNIIRTPTAFCIRCDGCTQCRIIRCGRYFDNGELCGIKHSAGHYYHCRKCYGSDHLSGGKMVRTPFTHVIRKDSRHSYEYFIEGNNPHIGF